MKIQKLTPNHTGLISFLYPMPDLWEKGHCSLYAWISDATIESPAPIFTGDKP